MAGTGAAGKKRRDINNQRKITEIKRKVLIFFLYYDWMRFKRP